MDTDYSEVMRRLDVLYASSADGPIYEEERLNLGIQVRILLKRGWTQEEIVKYFRILFDASPTTGDKSLTRLLDHIKEVGKRLTATK